MTFKALKQLVYQCLNKITFNKDDETNHINEILTGCLLLKMLKHLMGINPMMKSDIKSKAEEFVLTYRNIAESLEGKFVSYKKIKELIIGYNLETFLQISEKQINEIYKLYENKAELKEFNLHYFSQYMYNVSNAELSELKRLSNIHFKIIVPIIKYYITNFDIRPKDISIEDVGNEIGTEIKLSITNIRPTQIYSDILRDIMNVSSYIYEIEMTEDSSIKLCIK